MAAGDLTTLATVKAWLAIGNDNSNAILTPLISAASRIVLNYINRPVIFSQSYSDRLDGPGGSRMLLREFPVTAIASLVVDNAAVPAAVAPAAGASCPNGYLLEPADIAPPGKMQAIDLFGGYCFSRGRQNVAVTYTAGYLIAGEAQTVATAKATVNAPYGAWGADSGVVNANTGAAFVKVPGAPAVGQYQLDATTPGQYNFNAADNATPVLISYSFVPSDLAQAAMEMVGERFRYRDRIGQGSKTLAGQETITFSQKDMPDAVKLMLSQYRRLVPV